MVKDIVLVLLESSVILWGGFCALQLAKREGGQVYVLLDMDGDPSPEVTKLLAKLRSKAETEEIELKIYLSEDKDLESALLDLLKRKDTVQILVAIENREEIKDIEKWLEKIEKKLINQPDWPYSHLQYLVVPKPNDPESQRDIESYYEE
ncbi:hypothetical protein Thein_2068 [Thermodesulfatator indicus DSM 15286]|uniref:Uncharacterized protein n=1 Tax=Thermodesulfatator indicus (strain DSM 15286 / JCM 11887 / CIR29812) TaxID=667014 RepID=F8AD43_THEID|nr:hypothetical protein [Thermodesulfatator indicus]AEH45918.1 hypothetical protein Thein_2068 [Thermodesulfatator indicus DSM 15286]